MASERTTRGPLRLAAAGLALALLSSGCGSDAADSSDFEAYCESFCDWRVRCEPEDKAGCLANCEDQGGSSYSKVRADFLADLTGCYNGDSQCRKTGDTCYTEAVTATVPDPLDDPGYNGCMEVYERCKSGDDTAFSDDLCGTLVVLISAAQADFEACYDEPCEQIGACLKAVVGD